jgi:hypothetical protein
MKEKEDWNRIGYYCGVTWIADQTSKGADIVKYVFIADDFRTTREIAANLSKQGGYLKDYDPRKDNVVGSLFAGYFLTYGFHLVPSSTGGMIPSKDYINFEAGFVSAVRQHWNELPNRSIYSASALRYLEETFVRDAAPTPRTKSKYQTTKDRNKK